MKLEDIGITKEELLEKVAENLVEDLHDGAKRQIEQFIHEEIKGQIRSQVSAIIMDTARKTFDGTFQPVNCFGEREGEPTTIREMFVQRAKEWWLQKVNSNGEPSTSYGSNKTMAQYHADKAMSEVTKEIMNKEFEPLILDARQKLASAFTVSVQELVTKILGK